MTTEASRLTEVLRISATVVAVLALAMIPASATQAGESKATPCGALEPLTVDAVWLHQHLSDTGLAVVGVDSPNFTARHIPGAHYVTNDAITFPSVEKLARWTDRDQQAAIARIQAGVAVAGVRVGTRVVIYQEAEGNPLAAARAVTLLEAGAFAGRVSMLNGGLRAWQTAGFPLSNADTKESGKPVSTEPCPAESVFVNFKFVRDHYQDAGVVMVDARIPPLFTGAGAQNNQRPGHILGAVNLPMPSLLTSEGALKSEGELKRIFDALGARSTSLNIIYCHTGERASVEYLAANEVGLNARIFYGSWTQWSAHEDLPAQIGPFDENGQ